MKTIFLILTAVLAANAQPRSIRLGSTQVAVSSNQATPLSVTNYRVEFRVTKRSGTFDITDAGKDIFLDTDLGASHWWCKTITFGTGVLAYCQENDGSGSRGFIDITGLSDARIRFQRSINGIIGANMWSMEGWDGRGTPLTSYLICPANGTYTQIGTMAPACSVAQNSYMWNNSLTAGAAQGNTFDIAFARWDNTLVPVGSKPPVEVPSSAPFYAGYDFQNALTDSSAHSLNMTVGGGTCTGSCSYVDSLTYAPLSFFSGTGLQRLWRSDSTTVGYTTAANASPTLDSVNSFSSVNLNGAPTSFAWTVTSKPSTGDGTLGSASSATTTIALNDVWGTYAVQLAVTDSGGSNSNTVKIGAVPENTDHTLKYYVNPTTGLHDDAIQFLAGPKLMRYGTATLTGADKYEAAWLAAATNTSAGAWATHTAWPTITETAGGGTAHFSSTGVITCDTGSTCNFSSTVSNGDMIWLKYSLPNDSSPSARFGFNVTASTATTVTTDLGANPATLSCDDAHRPCYTWGKPDKQLWGEWNGSSAAWNYYNAAKGVFRLALVTGIDDFVTLYRHIEDEHWLKASGGGYYTSTLCSSESRCDSVDSAMIRAIDGNPGWWPGIMANQDRGDACTTSSPLAQGTTLEWRDVAYSAGADAGIALFAQQTDGSPDTTNRAAYCTRVKQCVNNVFSPTQLASGWWGYNPFASNPFSFPFLGSGSQVFFSGLMNAALYKMRDSMVQGCSGISDRAAVAATALSTLKASSDAFYSALDTNSGSFFHVNFTYGPSDGDAHGYLAGTVNVSGTAVTGSGTSFLTNFLPGKTAIGISGAAVGGANEVIPVSVVTDNTHMTLASPGTSATGASFNKAVKIQDYSGDGTITLTGPPNSSATVVGVGTHFTTQMLGDQTIYIRPYNDRRLYRVDSIADDTHATLSAPWTDATLSNHTYTIGTSYTDHCGTSNVTTCDGFAGGSGFVPGISIAGDTGLNIEGAIAGYGYYYSVSRDATYKTNGDNWFSGTFGVMGSTLSYTFCGLAKCFGQYYGAGENQTYLANRLDAPIPPVTQISVKGGVKLRGTIGVR